MDQESEGLKELIYQHYPRNQQAGSDSYLTSNEYIRLKAENARTNNADWLDLKAKLAQHLLHNNAEIYDYSVLGVTPTYHATFEIPNHKGIFCILLLSVIAPKWTYWISDTKSKINRFYTENTRESMFIDELGDLIKEYFPSYSYLPPESPQLIVTDIETALGKSNPWIYDLLFDDLET